MTITHVGCDVSHMGEALVGAIYGLGETGTDEDCKYIENYMNEENIPPLRAVMVLI